MSLGSYWPSSAEGGDFASRPAWTSLSNMNTMPAAQRLQPGHDSDTPCNVLEDLPGEKATGLDSMHLEQMGSVNSLQSPSLFGLLIFSSWHLL